MSLQSPTNKRPLLLDLTYETPIPDLIEFAEGRGFEFSHDDLMAFAEQVGDWGVVIIEVHGRLQER